MKINKIGDWTCANCNTILSLTKEELHCGKCNVKAELKDIFEMDTDNVYFNTA